MGKRGMEKITGDVSQDYVNTVKTNVKNKFNLSQVMLDSDFRVK